MNYLKDVTNLKNRYFAMRHGQSKANVMRILVTDPANGMNDYGLTDLGRKQAQESVENIEFLDKETIVYSSDFLRARETAEVVRKFIKSKPVNLEKRLRERGFGIFEMTPISNYAKVWAEDEANPDSKKYEVESANEVLSRVTSLIPDLERKYSGKNIILVSHGDPCQLLCIGFMKKPASEHSKMEHFANADIRELILKK